MSPTKPSVLRAMQEFQKIGTKEFLKKYTNGFPPHYMYLRHDGTVYPLKALWAAAHLPAVSARTFNSVQARNGLRRLQFVDAIRLDNDEAKLTFRGEGPTERHNPPSIFSADVLFEAANEGERYRKEISLIKRNAAVVAKAKRHFGCDCQVCGFNFSRTYGEIGRGFIEAHHKEPLSERGEGKKNTSIDDFAMLCANCHRMMHRGPGTLTMDELKEKIQNHK